MNLASDKGFLKVGFRQVQFANWSNFWVPKFVKLRVKNDGRREEAKSSRVNHPLQWSTFDPRKALVFNPIKLGQRHDLQPPIISSTFSGCHDVFPKLKSSWQLTQRARRPLQSDSTAFDADAKRAANEDSDFIIKCISFVLQKDFRLDPFKHYG